MKPKDLKLLMVYDDEVAERAYCHDSFLRIINAITAATLSIVN